MGILDMEISNILIANNIRSLSVQIMTYLEENYWVFSPYVVSASELDLYSNFSVNDERIIIKIKSGNKFEVSLTYSGEILYSKMLSPCNILNEELLALISILNNIMGLE